MRGRSSEEGDGGEGVTGRGSEEGEGGEEVEEPVVRERVAPPPNVRIEQVHCTCAHFRLCEVVLVSCGFMSVLHKLTLIIVTPL